MIRGLLVALLALAGARVAGLGFARWLSQAIDDAFDFELDAPAGPARRYEANSVLKGGPAW